MALQCSLCGKQFTSVKSLDTHGRYCERKQSGRHRSPSTASTSAIQAEGSRKCARFDDRLVDDDATVQDEEGSNDPGPSDANIRADSPPATRSRRSSRTIRLPKRLQDYVLFGDMSLEHVLPHAHQSTPPESDDRTATPPPEQTTNADTLPHPYQTVTNKLGVFRRYTQNPTWFPNDTERLDLIYDTPSGNAPPPSIDTNTVHEISSSNTEPYAPFDNFTVATYMQAYFSRMDTKSEKHATFLANAMQDTRFDLNDLKGFNAHVENVRLDKYLKHGIDPFREQDGWKDAAVYI